MGHTTKLAEAGCGRYTQYSLPASEPTMSFHGHDRHACAMLSFYAARCSDPGRASATLDRLEAFIRFARDHPDRMREPGHNNAGTLRRIGDPVTAIASGLPTADDVPVFTLHALDRHAAPSLEHYHALCQNQTHRTHVSRRAHSFRQFLRLFEHAAESEAEVEFDDDVDIETRLAKAQYGVARMRGDIPPVVPARIRVTQQAVSNLWAWWIVTDSNEQACTCDRLGSVSITTATSEPIALEPREFEVVAWTPNPHRFNRGGPPRP